MNLNFEEKNHSQINDPFVGIRTTKTIREIRNEIALDSPFGKKSIFYREEREIIKGKIPKL